MSRKNKNKKNIPWDLVLFVGMVFVVLAIGLIIFLYANSVPAKDELYPG